MPNHNNQPAGRTRGIRGSVSGQILLRSQLLIAAFAILAAPSARPAWAQLPDASGAALGLGDNYTALARGRNAVVWNPAGLGMPNNPTFSLAISPLRGVGTIGPITPKDLVQIGDRALTHAEKLDWLGRIRSAGQQQGTLGAGLTYLSLNVGRLALQVSSSMDGLVDLSPEASELLLFGNAGLTGAARPYSLEGSSFNVAATSTAALSYGHPLNLLPGQNLAVGVTVKYTVGHLLFNGHDAGSGFSADPLGAAIVFPVIHTDTTSRSWNNGSGYGLDIGAAWESGPLMVGIALQNVVNTFAWDESKLFYLPGSVLITSDSTDSDFDSHAVAGAPAEIRSRASAVADEFRYHPHLALGGAFRALPILTVVGELRHRRGDAFSMRSATHAGIGAELRPLRWIPLRGGYTKIPGGYQVSGGLGLEFGVVNLQLSAAHSDGDLGQGGIGMFVLSFGGS